MRIGDKQVIKRRPRVFRAAFTLVELLISVVIFATVMSGIIYGYVQANRFAEWNSMSLAAQSYALQGLECVRGQKWDLSANPIIDGMKVPVPPGYTNLPPQQNFFDVPVSGAPIPITNYIKLTQISIPSSQAQLRMVQSFVIWRLPLTGQVFSNSVTTYRAPDRQ